MKSMFKIFAYIWTLIKSCFSGTHRNGQSYTRLNETDIKLNFATESFSQVVKKARSDFKLIVVYLHSENHQDTDTFWDEIIQNEIFAEFINSRDFIIKMMDISTSEGYQMSQKLQVTSYPFLGILMANSQSPTLVARIEGITQLESILEILNTTYDRYSPILISDRHDATTQNLARQQREQQDREYQEALEADRKREEELKEAERLKLLEEERKIREEQEKLEQLNQLSNLKSELRKKFFDENGQLIQISKDVDTCLIRFRFPNGTTLQRNFKKTDSVNLLYELVFSLKTPNAPWETSESTTLDKIELSTTFPKKILNRSLTIEQEKCANETLLVREDI